MYVLGITGTFDRVDESVFKAGIHDSSATLVEDGQIIAAIEEERFNRFKHSGKLPLDAIAYCLREAGIGLGQIDKFVFNVTESYLNGSLKAAYRNNLVGGYWLGRSFIQQLLRREFGCNLDPGRFEFIDHHYAHAVSAFIPSGFEESLVVTLDGMGAGLSGSVWMGQNSQLIPLGSYDGLPRELRRAPESHYTVSGALVYRHYSVSRLQEFRRVQSHGARSLRRQESASLRLSTALLPQGGGGL